MIATISLNIEISDEEFSSEEEKKLFYDASEDDRKEWVQNKLCEILGQDNLNCFDDFKINILL